MAFCPGTPEGGGPKTARVGLPQLCATITSRSDLWSGQGLKQTCISRWEFSNGVSQATCTHRKRVGSQLFVVESQIASLTPNLSFCLNLCYRCPNGSCEPISDIYTWIAFQWYKTLLNARCFDPCNGSLKARESSGTPTPKMGAHLGMWVFILTLSPKARVTTL
jgi:hypothetical protein